MRTNRWIWALAMLVIAAIIRFWPQNYELMLMRSFAFQFLLVFAGITLYWFLRGRAFNAVLGVGSVLVINSFLPPVLTASEGQIQKIDGVVIAHFNVLMINRDHGSTIAQALNSDADLISFQEVNERWAIELENALTCKYPFHQIVARSNNYGIAVFSKTPFQNVNTFYSGGDPSIEGCVEVRGQNIHFLAMHTRSPLPYYNYAIRNQQLKEASERLSTVKGPKLLIGDLNAVPWDENIVALRRDTGLKDPRNSMASTFPKYGGIGKIPIDHILHSKDLRCTGFKTISGMGSDHLGVVGVFHLTQEEDNVCG